MVNQAIPDVDVAANNTTQPTVSPPTTPMATGLQVLTAISEPTSTNHVGIDTTSKATLYKQDHAERGPSRGSFSLHRPTPGASTAQIGSLAAFTSPTSLRTTSDRVASVMGSTTEDPATQPSSPVA